MDKANKSGVDVLGFQLWKDFFVATAVATLKITESHDGYGRVGVSIAVPLPALTRWLVQCLVVVTCWVEICVALETF